MAGPKTPARLAHVPSPSRWLQHPSPLTPQQQWGARSSAADERYPRAIRTAVDALSPGMLSDVLALDRGFAIVLIEEKRPADAATLDAVRPDIERQLRSRQQRLAMDKLARSLMAEAQVMVTDSSLAWIWETIK